MMAELQSSQNVNGQVPLWPPEESTNMKRNALLNFKTPCKYVISKTPLGEGSYSKVFECKDDTTSKHYACKRYTKKLVFGMENMLQNEFFALKAISQSHKHLLKLQDYFETEKYLFIITDLAKGGELFDLIIQEQKLPESQVRSIGTQLIDAISYLHENGIVHRDIKAENILFKNKTNSSILLADFGLAKSLQPHEQLFNKCGTLSYLAPEIVQVQKTIGYGFPVDVWAMGVVVYFMLCGYMPFDCETDQETIEAISNCDYLFEPLEYWSNVSNNAKEFIRKCFTKDPGERMTIVEAKSDSFLLDDHRLPDNLAVVPGLDLSQLTSTYSSISTLNTLPPSASNVSLINTLKESLSCLKKESFQKESLQRTSSNGTKLHGALCESPNNITEFNTPITSGNNSMSSSRVQSTDDLARLGDYKNGSMTSRLMNSRSTETMFYL